MVGPLSPVHDRMHSHREADPTHRSCPILLDAAWVVCSGAGPGPRFPFNKPLILSAVKSVFSQGVRQTPSLLAI